MDGHVCLHLPIARVIQNSKLTWSIYDGFKKKNHLLFVQQKDEKNFYLAALQGEFE